MASPPSSSFQNKALASLYCGLININIIGHFFKGFNISGLILATIGSSSASVIRDNVVVPHFPSQSWAAAWTSCRRGGAGLPSASWQLLAGQNESQTKMPSGPGPMTGILSGDNDLQLLKQTGEGIAVILSGART
jgi:hypothetical protein